MRTTRQWLDGYATFVRRRHKGMKVVTMAQHAQAEVEYVNRIRREAWNAGRKGGRLVL